MTLLQRTLFIDDIIAPWIIGAAIELTVSPSSQNERTTTSGTSAAGHGRIPAFLVSVDVVEVLLAV